MYSPITHFNPGKAPTSVSKFLAGGSSTALNKSKQGSLPDVRPIAVGEALRRSTGKYLCSLIKYKASESFQPLQLGVACASGSEKEVYSFMTDKHGGRGGGGGGGGKIGLQAGHSGRIRSPFS